MFNYKLFSLFVSLFLWAILKNIYPMTSFSEFATSIPFLINTASVGCIKNTESKGSSIHVRTSPETGFIGV